MDNLALFVSSLVKGASDGPVAKVRLRSVCLVTLIEINPPIEKNGRNSSDPKQIESKPGREVQKSYIYKGAGDGLADNYTKVTIVNLAIHSRYSINCKCRTSGSWAPRRHVLN
jgi:hypothetical protein